MKPFPIATALRESFREGYGWGVFKSDLISAFVVSLVALPLSMALAIAVGLPPQHGVYTAIVVGMVAPLLGGAKIQVSGPTAAFVVIVAPIIAEHGLRGIIISEIMAGVALLVLAWLRLGRFINFVPYPVTTGFTSGIAVVLATLSLNDFLGLGIRHFDNDFIDKLLSIVHHLPVLRWPEAAIGLLSIIIMFSGKKITSHVPSTILGIFAGTALALALAHLGMITDNIGNRFDLHDDALSFVPMLHFFGEQNNALFAWPTHHELRQFSMTAMVIAALAAMESLLSATVADGMAHTRHNPNAELAGIGIGNILSGLAVGIPATGAIARTTTALKSGARTPIASSLHAVFILLYVLLLARWIAYIPMASLAALMIVTAYNMSHYRQFFRILKIAPRQDVIVLLVCFGLTVFIDMVAGVVVGILLAALLFIQRIAESTEISVAGAEEATDLLAIPPNALLYRITGPVFFGSIERAFDRTAFLRKNIDTLLLDMEHVPLIDMSGMVAMKNLLESDALAGKRVILCGKAEITGRILQKLAHSHALRVSAAPNVYAALQSL